MPAFYKFIFSLLPLYSKPINDLFFFKLKIKIKAEFVVEILLTKLKDGIFRFTFDEYNNNL